MHPGRGALKAEDGKDAKVFGSASLLLDEYRLCLVPVVLGGGNPLFEPPDQQIRMRLEGARPLTTGGVILTYAVDG